MVRHQKVVLDQSDLSGETIKRTRCRGCAIFGARRGATPFNSLTSQHSSCCFFVHQAVHHPFISLAPTQLNLLLVGGGRSRGSLAPRESPEARECGWQRAELLEPWRWPAPQAEAAAPPSCELTSSGSGLAFLCSV